MILEHNKAAYEEAKKMLLEYRECCIIAATGIGKSNIATEIIQNLGLNALIIAPKASIRDNWTNMPKRYNFAPTISTITYQYFNRHYKSLYGFDAYIFDEAHHAGAPKWGAAIKEFREGLDTEFVLGLTADPNRYSDLDEKNRNVIESVFNNHAVYGHDQKSAIEQGILPRAKYVCAIYNTEEAFAKYEAMDLTDELKGRLNYTRTNCEAIEDILRNNVPKGTPIKGIVFVDTINNIDIGVRLARRAFPKEAVHYIHSKLSAAENAETLEMFQQAKSGFIVSVDMLNEGLHIEGINTIIMLRKTGSPTIYTQQIGRGLTANGKNVSIFDLVRNDTSIKKVLARMDEAYQYYEDKRKKKGDGTGIRRLNISDQFIMNDYATDILKVFEDIENYIKYGYIHRPWTSEEDKILRENYPTMGANVFELFDNRSKCACVCRANKLNIKFEDEWTTEEDKILRENYPTMGSNVINMLNRRSKGSCIARANKLGIYYNKNIWTTEEDKILREKYPTMGRYVSILLPGRTEETCLSRASTLGVKYIERNTRKWTLEEDQILRDNYHLIGTGVYNLLTDRSKEACKSRAKTLGLKYTSRNWNSYEDKILKENYPIIGENVYKMIPGRTRVACKNRARTLNIERDDKSWTEKEDQILKDYYPTMGSKVYTLLPNRTKYACQARAIHDLGLKFKK